MCGETRIPRDMCAGNTHPSETHSTVTPEFEQNVIRLKRGIYVDQNAIRDTQCSNGQKIHSNYLLATRDETQVVLPNRETIPLRGFSAYIHHCSTGLHLIRALTV